MVVAKVPEPGSSTASRGKSLPGPSEGLMAAVGSCAGIPYCTLVPGPTREAIHNLMADMQSKPFLDLEFFEIHVPALKPNSITGWLGLSATALLAVAGLSSLACLVLAIAAGLSYVGVFLAMTTTILLNIAGIFVFAGLMMTSMFSSSMGFVLAAGYVTVRLGSLIVERAKQS